MIDGAFGRLVAVFVGGGAGALTRYAITLASQAIAGHRFPVGTLACNVLGCMAAGAVLRLAVDRGEMGSPARLFVLTGFLGGLTTFSAFGFETAQLLRAGGAWAALANVALNVVLSLAAVGAGLLVADLVTP